MKKLVVVAVLLASVATSTVMLADVVLGTPPQSGNGNCYPFGCAYSDEIYQQAYVHTGFSGTTIIVGLDFYNTQLDRGATQMNSGTWSIYLSTSNLAVNSLSSTFANNIGPDETLIFSGNLNQPWAFGDTLHIAGSTPFIYNPANGDLLMTVVTSGVTAPGGFIYFDWQDPSTNTERIYNQIGPFGTTANNGLTTNFETSTVATPEPGSLLMLGSGMLGLAGYARRRFGK